MPTSCIEADYLLETPAEPDRVAEFMAGEQSSGTFVAVPGETAELKARVAARVTRLDILDEAAASPSLPVLGFAFLLSMVTSVVFGIVPAWITSHSDPAEALPLCRSIRAPKNR